MPEGRRDQVKRLRRAARTDPHDIGGREARWRDGVAIPIDQGFGPIRSRKKTVRRLSVPCVAGLAHSAGSRRAGPAALCDRAIA